MKFKLFSVIAGSAACIAKCPFCVSGLTPCKENMIAPKVNWRNLRIAAKLARQSGVDTVMITSRGEPMLFPEQITQYLDNLKEFNFPFIELQTNGILISRNINKNYNLLKKWHEKGLTTIAISIVHYDSEKNRQIYLPNAAKYTNLPELVTYLHKIGFSVRLACVSFKGFIDNPEKLSNLIKFAKENSVEQLTIRPVNDETRRIEASRWIKKHKLSNLQIKKIRNYLETNGTRLLDLVQIGRIYDVDNQNVCFASPLNKDTRKTDPDKARQLIFFQDGHIRYEWEKGGAILL